MGKLKKQKGEEKWNCWSWNICAGCFIWLGLFFFVGAGIGLGNVWTGSYKILRGIEGIFKMNEIINIK